MIIIPEKHLIIINPPRTGSSSLRRAIEATYPKAMLIYRHMEADGVPHGYDRFHKYAIVRHPLDRLWSLFKYLKSPTAGTHQPWRNKMIASSSMTFSEWLTTNDVSFTDAYSSDGNVHRFYPQYTVMHSLPENKKSQFVYARPDLGTTIIQFHELTAWAEAFLGVRLDHHNESPEMRWEELTRGAKLHMAKWFVWDYQVYRGNGNDSGNKT